MTDPDNSVPSATAPSDCPLNEGHAGWLDCPIHAKAINDALAAIGMQSRACRHVHSDGRVCGRAPNACIHPENAGYPSYIEREGVRLDPHSACHERERKLREYAMHKLGCRASIRGRGALRNACTCGLSSLLEEA